MERGRVERGGERDGAAGAPAPARSETRWRTRVSGLLLFRPAGRAYCTVATATGARQATRRLRAVLFVDLLELEDVRHVLSD